MTLQEQLQGQTTLPEAAAPAVSLHLGQISGNVHTLQSGKTRDNAWLRKARQYTALVIVRSPGESLGGSFLQKNVESHVVGAEPLGDDKILALPCVHDTGESPGLDSHCQVLNFIIHATLNSLWNCSRHRKQCTCVGGLPLNTNKIPSNARIPTPTPRPEQVMEETPLCLSHCLSLSGVSGAWKTTHSSSSQRKTRPWKTPHIPPYSFTLENVSWFLLSQLVFFFSFQFTSLSQRNAFLVRKFLKSVSDLLKTRKATTFTLSGQTCRLPCCK